MQLFVFLYLLAAVRAAVVPALGSSAHFHSPIPLDTGYLLPIIWPTNGLRICERRSVDNTPIASRCHQRSQIAWGQANVKLAATGYCFGGLYTTRLVQNNTIAVGTMAHPSSLNIPTDFELVKA
ncbi:hypothetical protein DFH08DRAFT_929805 [Mycena albidolilacea]|uniref:Uncharacterized protein n=1 Tax=Mycena albidolilacea TaxID=1033008 RepID=A0AAD7ASI4_9AGAR|nr:hypothetical protein DFH08DRAFT_929805 [Mycena albidolilacea]